MKPPFLIKKRFLSFFIISISSLWSIDQAVQNIDFGNLERPLFTGPLLAPSGYVVQKGHFNIQPYYTYFVINGFYDSSWDVVSKTPFINSSIALPFKVGLGYGLDIGLNPLIVSQFTNNQKTYGLSDWGFSLGYQLYNAKLSDFLPGLKLAFRLSLPIGKYQNLNPQKLRTDALGDGSWWSGVGLSSSKLWYLKGIHFFELRAAITYFISTPVKIKGYNFYGGSYDTNATMHIGNRLNVNLAGQYNLSKHWALACDLVYRHQNSSYYTGFAGSGAKGALAFLNTLSLDVISIAPAIEYNFNENIGLIAGSWLSIIGRNAGQFRSGIISLNIYY